MAKIIFGIILMVSASVLMAQGMYKADLNGYNEVPTLSTTGSGQLAVKVSSDQRSLNVTLTFTKLEGVAQSVDLRLGMPGMTGGLLAWICGGLKPSCPTAAQGSATATITANDIQAVPGQGIAAADLASVILALENGAVYAHISTNKFQNGEIRGQLGRGNGGGNGRGRGN